MSVPIYRNEHHISSEHQSHYHPRVPKKKKQTNKNYEISRIRHETFQLITSKLSPEKISNTSSAYNTYPELTIIFLWEDLDLTDSYYRNIDLLTLGRNYFRYVALCIPLRKITCHYRRRYSGVPHALLVIRHPQYEITLNQALRQNAKFTLRLLFAPKYLFTLKV